LFDWPEQALQMNAAYSKQKNRDLGVIIVTKLKYTNRNVKITKQIDSISI